MKTFLVKIVNAYVKTADSKVATEELVTVNVTEGATQSEQEQEIEAQVSEWKNNQIEWGWKYEK